MGAEHRETYLRRGVIVFAEMYGLRREAAAF